MMTRSGCAVISKCSCHRLPARQNDGHAEPPEARALYQSGDPAFTRKTTRLSLSAGYPKDGAAAAET